MHTLRHAAAMNLLAAGVDISVIALWLGHQHPLHRCGGGMDYQSVFQGIGGQLLATGVAEERGAGSCVAFGEVGGQDCGGGRWFTVLGCWIWNRSD